MVSAFGMGGFGKIVSFPQRCRRAGSCSATTGILLLCGFFEGTVAENYIRKIHILISENGIFEVQFSLLFF